MLPLRASGYIWYRGQLTLKNFNHFSYEIVLVRSFHRKRANNTLSQRLQCVTVTTLVGAMNLS